MEVNERSQDANRSNETDEQLESSTTGDSSEVYAYYPSIDFSHSTRKIKSRLGKRRNTINPIRISNIQPEAPNERNNVASISASSYSIFSESATRMKNDLPQQLTPAKDVLGPSSILSERNKQGMAVSFDLPKSTQKSREVFSTWAHSEMNSSNRLKKFESPGCFRSKSSETLSKHIKNVKSLSLDDSPLDSDGNIKPTTKMEPPIQRSRLNVDLDSRDFINIFDMPSVKLREATPPRVFPSLSLPQLRNPKAGNQSVELSLPSAKRQLGDASPQESEDKETALDLSIDKLNTTANTINTESFKPKYNSSVIGELDFKSNKENEKKGSKLPVSKVQPQDIFKLPTAEIAPMKAPTSDPFKKPVQPSSTSGNSAGIPSSVSQPQIANPKFILPKLNPRPQNKPYSFASDVAKFCQKESAPKVTVQTNPLPSQAKSNVQAIKVKNKSYHIHSTIGRGGSSEVYKVEDPTSKSFLAVKVVKLASVDEAIAEGYMNEVKLLEKVQGCTSVIRMFDYEYIEESKKLYVVMELGETDLSRLLKDIKKTKEISPIRILYYWTEMLTAVQEIHEKGRLKLIDFGIASSLQGDMTSVHKDICAGTQNYMSPEAIKDGTGSSDKKYKISYKSDVWSLGCILYNLIYGKTPFSHITSPWGKMYAIISSSHKIDFPDHRIPPVLRQAMQWCLIRDPKQRPTVKDLLDCSSGFLFQSPCIFNCKDLPQKIQQIVPEEYWQKIAPLFSASARSNGPQRN